MIISSGSGGGGFKLRTVRNAKKNYYNEHFYSFDYSLWLHQIVFAFCYFTINDFILDYFFDKRKSLYSKISIILKSIENEKTRNASS